MRTAALMSNQVSSTHLLPIDAQQGEQLLGPVVAVLHAQKKRSVC